MSRITFGRADHRVGRQAQAAQNAGTSGPVTPVETLDDRSPVPQPTPLPAPAPVPVAARMRMIVLLALGLWAIIGGVLVVVLA